MSVYYNEIDLFCCDWLRQLIKRGLLPDGEIDNRSIEDVKPDDLKGFTQCHFFAGIGGWPYALRLAGCPDDRPVWTGSCPCQPFSTAGKRAGTFDKRHLWPSFFWLISQCRPDTIIGEQVASKDALAWWDIVHTDLEAADYACGVCDTCAAGFGAPHIRQRLYWVAHSASKQKYEEQQKSATAERKRSANCVARRGVFNALADTTDARCERRETSEQSIQDACHNSDGHIGLEYAQCSGLQGQPEPDRSPQGRQEQTGCPVHAGDETGGLGIAEEIRRQPEQTRRYGPPEKRIQTGSESGACVPDQTSFNTMPTNGFWANPDWLWCRDKKWRPIESRLTPLVDGLSEGMVSRRDSRAIRQRLQGYGNAIVVPQAVEFVRAVIEII